MRLSTLSTVIISFGLGLFIAFMGTVRLADKFQTEREYAVVKIQSLQSCYFSAVKLGKVNPDVADKFCREYSDSSLQTYREVGIQMDQITDEMYSPVNYYKAQLKKLFAKPPAVSTTISYPSE